MEKGFSRSMTIVVIIIIVIFVILLIALQIKDHFSQDDPKIQEIKRILEEIAPKATSRVRIYKGDKSYTINKRNVYLCLNDEKGDYYDNNVLIMVALHEIAHSLCKSIGHTQEFDEIFKKLLKRAEELGYYDPKKSIPSNYCEY